MKPSSISYGLKLWSNNTDLFEPARKAHESGAFDFIEILYNPDFPLEHAALETLRGIPVNIHATNKGAFHEFVFGETELSLWRDIVALADLFSSKIIVLHP